MSDPESDSPESTHISLQEAIALSQKAVKLSLSEANADIPFYGLTVLIYLGHGNYEPVTLTKDGDIHNKCGYFRHEDFVGKPFGTRIYSRSRNNGYLFALKLTPELWTISLPHRTQILYAPDIAMVVMRLGLRNGSIVVESGTGSGSLTHSLARAVGPLGKVMTYEFNEVRVHRARAEFSSHGLSDVVTVTHRDAVNIGFQPETAPHTADGVFLDLPNPWHAVKHARRCLKPCGVVCSFSPCIEQVQRVCLELEAQGFEDIVTMETLGRYYDVQVEPTTTNMPKFDLFADSGVEVDRIVRGKRGIEAVEIENVLCVEGLGADALNYSELTKTEETTNESSSKKITWKSGSKTSHMKPIKPLEDVSTSVNNDAPKDIVKKISVVAPWPSSVKMKLPFSVRPTAKGRGHTGFLTFATLYRLEERERKVSQAPVF